MKIILERDDISDAMRLWINKWHPNLHGKVEWDYIIHEEDDEGPRLELFVRTIDATS